MKKTFWTMALRRVAAAVALLVASAGVASAQESDWDQDEACPGWNNPTEFIDFYNGLLGSGGYSGQGGTVPSSYGGKVCPNVMTSTLGFNLATNPSYQYNATRLNQGVYRTLNQCSSTSYSKESLPDRYKSFYINTNATGTDPNTDGHLKYVPTQFNTYDSTGVNTTFTRSIRVGDACYDPQNGEYGAACLYYTMDVNSQNAMLTLYYAIVAEAPTHGMKGNPTFIVRVMRQDGSGWQQISDTMAYYITTTPQSNANYAPCPNMTAITPLADYNEEGWHSAQSGNVYYKDWAKITLNLSNFLTKKVRVEIIIYDCEANFHYAYAYIAGECRPMGLQSSGCPAGESQDVTTLTAPRNLKGYRWYASEYGATEEAYMYADDELPFSTRYFTFRPLTDSMSADTGYTYHVKADDFRVTYRPNAGHVQGIHVRDSLGNITDSVGNTQLFRCTMWSSIDPAKIFPSNLYVKVQNTKPTMEVQRLSFCGGDVQLKNFSYVPGSQSLVNADSTRWIFYSDTTFADHRAVDTFYAADTALHFDGNTPLGLLVRTNIDETQIQDAELREQTPHNSCYSEQKYIIQPLPNPVARMTIDDHVLCSDNSSTTVRDRSTDITDRRWNFLPADAADGDTALTDTVWGMDEDNQNFTREFSHGLEPIRLTVRNGLFYLDTTATQDTVWCQGVANDTIAVFINPELQVSGDTIVCQGRMTDAHVRVPGADNCTFRWFMPSDHSNPIATGADLQVVPYADQATYDVEVTSHPDGCKAWSDITVYLVKPTLTYSMPREDDERICPGDEVRLFGGNADHYTWSASPADPSLAGQETSATIKVTPTQNTVYTLVGHGAPNLETGDPGCNADPLTKTVSVLPVPEPRVSITPEIVDADDPTVVLRDISTYSVGARWVFDDGTSATGTEISHDYGEVTGMDKVYATLYPHNVLGCETSYRFSIPVNMYTAWLPTAFTPGSEDVNARFRLYTINEYEYFHIYIYNRRGELVFESAEPTFEWDGTSDGKAMPQGAYVYVCRYRKPGMNTLSELRGTVTLIR